jgi:endoglucanase
MKKNRKKVIYVLTSLVLMMFFGCSSSSAVKKGSDETTTQILNQAGINSIADKVYPNYNTNPLPADIAGMKSTAPQIAAKMGLGWNIGNALEATGGESGWGSPKITKSYINFIKKSGFNSIRIPCSWNQYSDPKTLEISKVCLDRVKELVQYCVEDNMYVLINIHWDGGWLENNVTEAKKAENNVKQKAFWEQIATHLRNFDQHLIFASANEPNVEVAAQMAVLTSYHQTFIDAVRATGGKNAYRILVIQGPGTDIAKTNSLMCSLPVDTVANRLMVEVHNYTPFPFTLLEKDADWSKMFFYWGNNNHSTIEPGRNATFGEESDQDKSFQELKTKFVDKGIPVILGEYGAYRRSGGSQLPLDMTAHQNAVDYWITYITKKSIDNGVIPFFWDIGGVIDRSNNKVMDQRTIDAISAGAN